MCSTGESPQCAAKDCDDICVQESEVNVKCACPTYDAGVLALDGKSCSGNNYFLHLLLIE